MLIARFFFLLMKKQKKDGENKSPYMCQKYIKNDKTVVAGYDTFFFCFFLGGRKEKKRKDKSTICPQQLR